MLRCDQHNNLSQNAFKKRNIFTLKLELLFSKREKSFCQTLSETSFRCLRHDHSRSTDWTFFGSWKLLHWRCDTSKPWEIIDKSPQQISFNNLSVFINLFLPILFPLRKCSSFFSFFTIWCVNKPCNIFFTLTFLRLRFVEIESKPKCERSEFGSISNYQIFAGNWKS